MNPWDTKLVSDLSEGEMMSYVNYLLQEDRFRAARDLEERIDAIVKEWQNMRLRDNARFYGPTRIEFHDMDPTELYSSAPPLAATTIRRRYVTVYSWMDEEHVRYIAREQLTEQMS